MEAWGRWERGGRKAGVGSMEVWGKRWQGGRGKDAGKQEDEQMNRQEDEEAGALGQWDAKAGRV